ncbi:MULTISPECIES: DUF3099 domain-containing protein [Streptomyces]|uniref:DUF3099 domain-containing protein n=1 Tax=Streptomyces TaxID=1883 RepID=UPI002248F2A7|nr:DUF3099 domain-containing protein [Streptomyces sp. JHD 1]MCX2971304.1 DUF3099 domain-containing protein [Streptomyces sp. JHD 1]
MRRKQHGPEVFRITGARQGLTDDVRGRQRRYVIAMLVRTLSVLLTVALWNVSRPLAVVALVLGGLLPYVAVVIANAGRENAGDLPATLVPPPGRPELGSPAADPAEPAPPREPDEVLTADGVPYAGGTRGAHAARGAAGAGRAAGAPGAAGARDSAPPTGPGPEPGPREHAGPERAGPR